MVAGNSFILEPVYMYKSTKSSISTGSNLFKSFSDYYSVAANETKTVYFRNYSNKLQNYFNWLIGLTNDVDRGGDGYTEHVVLRADNYLIQNPHSGALTSNYDWSTFKDELDGALVKMNVARSGSTVTVTAKQIAATDQSPVPGITAYCPVFFLDGSPGYSQ